MLHAYNSLLGHVLCIFKAIQNQILKLCRILQKKCAPFDSITKSYEDISIILADTWNTFYKNQLPST